MDNNITELATIRLFLTTNCCTIRNKLLPLHHHFRGNNITDTKVTKICNESHFLRLSLTYFKC